MRSLPLYQTPPYLALELDLSAPRSVDPGCAACALHDKVRSVCMPAEGAPGGLLVVADAPVAEDDRQGVPFASPTGRWVRTEIAKHWGGPVAFDHALRCWPGAREVPKAAIAACRPYLAATYLEVAPQRVLALGYNALRSVIGRSFHVQSARKGYAYMPSTGVPVFMLMPADMGLRNRYLRPYLEQDLAWACTASPPRAPIDGLALYVETAADAADACFDLETDGRPLSWDVETFGAPFNREFKIVTFSVCPAGADSAWVWDEAALRDPARAAPLRRLLENPRVAKGGQNIKYDKLAARAFIGANTRGTVFDVRLMRKLLEANALIQGLEVMQTRVGMGGGKDEAAEHVDAAVKNLRGHIHNRNPGLTPTGKPRAQKAVAPLGLDAATHNLVLDRVEGGVSPKSYAYAWMPEDVRGVYCARDTVSTGLLRDVYAAELAADPALDEHWRDVVLPLEHAITEMEFNGVKIGRPALAQLQASLATKIADLQSRLAPYVWPGFNVSASSADTGKLLFNKPTDDPPGLGIPPTRITPKSGKPGTGIDDIKDIAHPVVPIVLELRKAMHFDAQYASGLAWHIRDDGRIHTSYKIDGTSTGRPSTENPNLLNIPRASSPEGKMCRDLFVAEDGFVLVEGDYNQIELRVAAMLSDDDVMIGMFQAGLDFHLATAQMIAPYFGLKAEDIDKEHPLRSRAKIVNFGVLYGKDAYGLSMELGISKKEAQTLVEAILGKFRKLARWIQSQLAEGRRLGYTRTWWADRWTRYRPLPELASHNDEERQTAERSTWNTTIQGTATEFTNASLGAIQRDVIEGEMLPARLVLTVYDSIIAEVREDCMHEYAHHANRIMCGWRSRNMPILADFKWGYSWGTMEKLEVAT